MNVSHTLFFFLFFFFFFSRCLFLLENVGSKLGYHEILSNIQQRKTDQTELVAWCQVCPLVRSAGVDGYFFLHTIDPGKSCSLTVKYVASSYYICMCIQIHKSDITVFWRALSLPWRFLCIEFCLYYCEQVEFRGLNSITFFSWCNVKVQ